MGYKFNPFTGTFDETGGAPGPAGAGVPIGGTTGEVLAKKSNTDYDTEWVSNDSVSIDASAADVLSASGGAISADDPGADRLVFWDDSTGKLTHLELGTNLSITDTTINAAGGGGGTPGGSDTQIQYNDSGSFGGSADLTWDDTAKELGVGGDINLDDGGTYTTTVQCVTPTANRTISFPDATGTVGLVAGSSGQLISNQSGAYAGVASSSVDGSSNITIGTRFISSLNGALSTTGIDGVPVAVTGTWITGGTTTTNKPHVLIEPTGTTSTGWSTSGTGLGVNAPSGFSGRILDLQLNGVSEWVFGTTGLTVGDANDIALGTTTGTKIGTATSQKLAFYNKTPIVQPTTGVAEAAFVENSGGTSVNVDSTFGGYTIQQVVQALQNLGFLA